MSDCIKIDGIRVYGSHGIGDERKRPQPFVVSVELRCDLAPAAAADDLSATTDYGVVARVVGEVVESTSFQLIEALAEAIAGKLHAEFSPSSVSVCVAKPWAARDLGVDEVAARVER